MSYICTILKIQEVILMKTKGYIHLSNVYYDNQYDYLNLYESRINSEECIHLDFLINDSPAFFIETPELLKAVIEITRIDKEIKQIMNALPQIALNQYIHKCLIDEIVLTNSIEGVYSTRKEIGDLLDNPKAKSKRFVGLVKKYIALTDERHLPIESSTDVRSFYDEMFLPEVIEDDPNNIPDGKIFRNGPVEVINSAQKVIHQGLFPESKIIESIDKAIKILNDKEIEPLFRIAIFHYLFGYIHPFYDGNGRLNRFISSYYLANTLESIMAFRLSYTIKENVNRYYKSFKVVNSSINKGDITPFIYSFVDFIKESCINLRNGLKNKSEIFNNFIPRLEALPNAENENYKNLYFYLLQASLFSELGISTSDLLKCLNISRPTLQKRLKVIDKQQLLITINQSPHKFYKLNLDVVNKK